jgi:hypothetical protein
MPSKKSTWHDRGVTGGDHRQHLPDVPDPVLDGTCDHAASRIGRADRRVFARSGSRLPLSRPSSDLRPDRWSSRPAWINIHYRVRGHARFCR